MERTTKTITTPSDQKVELYEYITGGEMRRFQGLFLEDMSASDVVQHDGEKATQLLKASTMMEAQELALKMLVVSVDGEKEGAYEAVMDMRPEDTDFVFSEVDKLTSPQKKSEAQPQATQAAS